MLIKPNKNPSDFFSSNCLSYLKKTTKKKTQKFELRVRLFVCLCHLYESVTLQLHACSTPECTFQRQDSSWACWTFACYQELRVKRRELIFCLLEVHSLGLGRSLAHSLGCHAVGSLPHPHPTPPLSNHRHAAYPPRTTTTTTPHSLTLSLFLCLCVAAASAPADTCPAVTGRDVRWAADTRIDLPPFPHKLHIKLLETLEETKNGREGRDKGLGRQPEWNEEKGENSPTQNSPSN